MYVIPKIPRASGGFAPLGPIPGFYPGPVGPPDPSPTHAPLTTNPGSAPDNSPYFDGRIKMNSPYPEITNISSLAKLFFKTFISLKHLSDYRTVGLSDYSYGLL